VSIRYNQARTLESQHQLEAAVVAYKALLAEYPKYLDCELGLALGLPVKSHGEMRLDRLPPFGVH